MVSFTTTMPLMTKHQKENERGHLLHFIAIMCFWRFFIVSYASANRLVWFITFKAFYDAVSPTVSYFTLRFIHSHQPLTCKLGFSAVGLSLSPARWAGFQVSFSPLKWDWMVSRSLNHLQSQISWKKVREIYVFIYLGLESFSQECSSKGNLK